MTSPKLTVDDSSVRERRAMEAPQSFRTRLLAPLLELCTNMGIPAGGVLLLSLLCGLAFVPLWMSGAIWTALPILPIHLLLEALAVRRAATNNETRPHGRLQNQSAGWLCWQVSLCVYSLHTE